MPNYTSYKVKIKNQNKIFTPTVKMYNQAVNFFIKVVLEEWSTLLSLKNLERNNSIERLTIQTKMNPFPKYHFSNSFYKFPSYLRRAAIGEAIGMISSYKSNLENWLNTDQTTKEPSIPQAIHSFPAMYRDKCFVMTGTYTAKIKVFIRNTWDWLEVELRKSDIDYIKKHCKERTMCVPTLQKIDKEWFLRFAFEDRIKLNSTDLNKRLIMGVDLGINNACVCTIMDCEGTIHGRTFLSLPRETDSLNHAINRIKKAQSHGARKMPRLWAKVNGINEDIASKTAKFITNYAIQKKVDIVVFEHLDLKSNKKGSRNQKITLWKAKYIQRVVTSKIHRHGIRMSRVNAKNTSRFAFDGSGRVTRGSYIQNGVKKYNYSICTFTTGRQYNCDLNASYNIGARYFIREYLKSFTETQRLDVEVKIPQLSKRTTCTLSTLIKLVSLPELIKVMKCSAVLPA